MPRAFNVSNGDSRARVRVAISAAFATAQPCSWRNFGARHGVSGALLNAVARGTKPPPDSVLRAFGFPVPRVVEVPDGYGVGQACGKCGAVHTTKRCTQGATIQRKPRMIADMSRAELRAAFENRKEISI